jgi:hypothetical protein
MPRQRPTMGKSKAHKPAFDIAHVDISDSHAGWVYKSSAPAPVVPTSDSLPRIVVPDAVPRPSHRRRPADETHGWVETGARVLVFPLACAMVAMAAPLIWVLAQRGRQ